MNRHANAGIVRTNVVIQMPRPFPTTTQFYGPYYGPNDLPPMFDIIRDQVDSFAPRTRPFVIAHREDGAIEFIVDRRQNTGRRKALRPRRAVDREAEEDARRKNEALDAQDAVERKIAVAKRNLWFYGIGVITGFLAGLLLLALTS